MFETHEDEFISSYNYDPNHVDLNEDESIHNSQDNSQAASIPTTNSPYLLIPNTRNSARTRNQLVSYKYYVIRCTVEPYGTTQTSKTYFSPHFPPTFLYI